MLTRTRALFRPPRQPSPEELEALARTPADWPRRCFFVCSTPRCGSTLLGGLLASTGRVGRPAEYFSKKNEPDWAATSYAEFVAFTKRLHATDGIFGAKVHWLQLRRLVAGLRAVASRRRLSDRDLLGELFGQPQYVWLRRLDLVAQGVSWAKADQTGLWASTSREGTGREPWFDFERIHRRISMVSDYDRAWGGWFDANGIEPFTITYEQLVDDLEGVTRSSLEFLGVDLPPDGTIGAHIEQLFDEVNEEWIARYRALTEGRTRVRH